MNPSPQLKNIAQLRNVVNLTALIMRVKDRTFGLPGMATFHGPSGYGKSSALVYAALKTNAVAVEVQPYWTRKSFCEAILLEMGVEPGRTITVMADQICEHLATYERPLVLDEADHLMRDHFIEIVRSFYDASGAPVILIGEEGMPQKLKRWERVHNRMLDWVGAEPANTSDARELAGIYARNVDVAGDLLERIRTTCQGNTRRICVNLEKIREFAVTHGLDHVDLKAFGDRDLFTGTAPSPRERRFGAGGV